MFQKENRPKLIILVIIGVLLSVLYSFNLKEMFKRILEWGFALIGFDILFENGLIKRVERLADEIKARRM